MIINWIFLVDSFRSRQVVAVEVGAFFGDKIISEWVDDVWVNG